ncbi:MAG: CoA transferase [Dehalococcoidia bacterium]|nr:CoA transferase [Dehalococcoidia bacterium]
MPFTSLFAEWLKGVQVLDFTAVLAGPHMSRVLAQAGADVVKVEAIPVGDTTRGLPYRFTGGQSGYFKQQNLGKRGIGVNLASEAGHRIAMQLAAQSQVVLENFRPGVVDKLGLGYEHIRAVRPDVVYVSISGWGQTGPFSRMTGEVRSTTSLSGLMAADHDGEVPGWERCSFGDTNASIHCVAAIAAGLLKARNTGASTHVDFSILEGLMATNVLELPEVLSGAGAIDGREKRTSGDHARVASGNFVCADGEWVYIRAVSPAAWRALCEIVELKGIAGLGFIERMAHAGQVYAIIEAWCASRGSGQVLDELGAAGIGVAPVRSVREAIADPATREAGLVQDVPDAFAGKVPVPTGLFASTAFGRAPQRPEPLHGQHTREVLTGLLGYSDAAVDELVAAGVVQEHPLPAVAP